MARFDLTDFEWSVIQPKRNLVERFVNKIKHYRAVATRYDKREDDFLANIKARLNPHLVAL